MHVYDNPFRKAIKILKDEYEYSKRTTHQIAAKDS
jgi:hypothetical protein